MGKRRGRAESGKRIEGVDGDVPEGSLKLTANEMN
jgi:hypothetical protein